MAVMRAIAEGGVGLDWSRETAVDEAMERQGGLRLRDTLSKIKDYVPPPPESSSESESESEEEKESRGDTDEENLLFSDDDCVLTSGDEDSDSDDGDDEKEKPDETEDPPAPVLSGAEILAARNSVIKAATASASVTGRMAQKMGAPPSVLATAKKNSDSKLPPIVRKKK
jgi:hypothetical protein